MSKVDAMRALREARYAAAAKGAAPAAAQGGSCGHRNMGGKSCTREPDHVQNGTRNHRYG